MNRDIYFALSAMLLLGLSLVSMSGYNVTGDTRVVFYDDFQDGDFTNNPTWTVDTNDDGGVVDIWTDGSNYAVKMMPDSNPRDRENVYLESEHIYFNGVATVEFSYILLGCEASQGDKASLNVWGQKEGETNPDWHIDVWSTQDNTDSNFHQVSVPLSEFRGSVSIVLQFAFDANYYKDSDSNADRFYVDDVVVNDDITNVNNTPPEAPTLSDPGDNSTIPVLQPTLNWNPSSDPDGNHLTYNLQVSVFSDFSTLVVDLSGISGTSYSFTFDLVNGNTYFWRVRANDSMALSPWSDTWQFHIYVNSPPETPVLQGPPDGSTVITRSPEFTWTCSDPDNDPLSYIFEVTDESAPWVSVLWNTTVSNTTYKLETTLMNGNAYKWRVKAFDGTQYSDWSDVWHFIIDENIPPTAPTTLSPTVTGNKTPRLTWSGQTDANDDKLSFKFFMGTANGTWDIVNGTVVTEPQYTPTEPLHPWQTYYVKIISYDGFDFSADEFFGSVNIINNPPTLPDELLNTTISSKSPIIEWPPAVDPDGDKVLSYQAEIRSGGVIMPLTTINGTSFVPDVDLDIGEYTIALRAFDGYNYSEFREYNFTVVGNLPPSPPISMSPTYVESEKFTLTWTGAYDPDGDNLAYWVTIRRGGTVVYGPLMTLQPYLVLDNILIEGHYNVTITAFDGDANSTTQFTHELVVADVNLRPYPPTTLSPNRTSDPQPTLTWSGAYDPEGAELYYFIRISKVRHTGDVVVWSRVDNNSFTVPVNLYPRTYYVEIKADDGYVQSDIFETELEITWPENRPPSFGDGELEQSTQDSMRPKITWPEAVDPDGDTVTYDIIIYNDTDTILEGNSNTNSFTPDKDIPPGDYSVSVKGKDSKGAVCYLNGTITIKDTSNYYKVSVDVPEVNYTVYQGHSLEILYTLTNDGIMPTIVTLSIDGSISYLCKIEIDGEIYSYDGAVVNIPVGGKKDVSIIVNVPEDMSVGTYHIDLVVSVTHAGAVDTDGLNIDVKESKNIQNSNTMLQSNIYVFLIVILSIIVLLLGVFVLAANKKEKEQKKARNDKKDRKGGKQNGKKNKGPSAGKKQIPKYSPHASYNSPVYTMSAPTAPLPQIAPAPATGYPLIAHNNNTPKPQGNIQRSGGVQEVVEEAPVYEIEVINVPSQQGKGNNGQSKPPVEASKGKDTVEIIDVDSIEIVK